MPEAESPKLDYEKRLPVYQRRRWLIVLLVALAALGVSTWRWGPAVRGQLKLLQFQRRCLQYTPATTQPLYDGDMMWPRPTPAAPPKCWTDWVGASRIANPPTGIVVFLHERKTPAGKRRLVVVTEHPDQFGPFFPDHPTAFVYQCAGLTTLPRQLWATDIDEEANELRRETAGGDFAGFFFSKFRLHAGVADPNDPTHFTIRCDINKDKGVTDGYLQNDDSVKWESHADQSR